MNNPDIYLVSDKTQQAFLGRKTVPFDFAAHAPKETDELLRRMRRIMREANGIGLSANQIGLPHRLFVAEVPGKDGNKFYAVFNPQIEKIEKEKVVMEEGCLSVPGIYGDVERPARLTLRGQDKRGKPVRIKAWGMLARVFQHEVDHLDGKVFLEKAKTTYRAHPQGQSAAQQSFASG